LYILNDDRGTNAALRFTTAYTHCTPLIVYLYNKSETILRQGLWYGNGPIYTGFMVPDCVVDN